MSTQSKPRLTPEQYLEIERKAEFKSEYFDGQMFPMQGTPDAKLGPPAPVDSGGWAHNRLVANAIALLWSQLRSRPCQVASSGTTDVAVVCGKPEFLDKRRDAVLNPTLIVEVLSPSTEAYDRGRKFEHYRSVESVNEYLLIASEHIWVDLFTRQSDAHWLLTSASSLEDVVELKSIGCRLSVTDLYAQVDLA